MRRILLCLALCIVLAPAAFAAHYHLKANGTGDFASIQAAINAASTGDTIYCADGTYTGTGNSDIDFGGKNLIVRSESDRPKYCIIDPSGRGFYFHSGESANAIVQGFTIHLGSADYGGGVYILNSSPTIFNCVIRYCYASGDGGGVYIQGTSSYAQVLNCVIEHNHALGKGGGVYFHDSHGIVKGTTIVYNEADNASGGGGAYNDNSTSTVNNCIIYGNWNYQVMGVWYNLAYNLIQGWVGDPSNWDGNPAFVSGADGGYYLDPSTSGAVDKGNDQASAICYTTADGSQCMDRWTTRADQHGDAGVVDVGYHYPHDGANLDVPGYMPTIQAAIDAAWNGDVVRITDNTYTGDGNRDLDTKGKIITVRSLSGVANACVINCQGSSGTPHRGFSIHLGETQATKIQNIKIINGWASYGGGMNLTASSPSIEGCIFSGNHATVDGGAIMNSQGNPSVTNCTFLNNSADDAGGGMLNHTCAPVLTSCLFQSNSAVWGGGGVHNYHANPTLDQCTFNYNMCTHAGSMGGGVHNDGSNAASHMNGCIFQENQAGDGGGAYGRNGAHPTFTDCEFNVNATLSGGRGGGIYSTGSSFTAIRCTFGANEAAVDGGGIYGTSYNSALIDSCLFLGNEAGSGGGGIYFYDHDNSTVSNCTFYQNDSPNGGGMWTWLNCTTTVVRDIFRMNRASTAGIAIGINSACWMSLSCCDIEYGQTGVYVGGGSTLAWGSGNFDADPRFCHVDHGDYRIHSTSPCTPANTGGCGLIGARPVGCTQTGAEAAAPPANRLHQPYPNPFNPMTRIAFDVSEAGAVSIGIYDVSGRLVRTLVEKAYAAGSYSVVWNGTNNDGRAVASGTYFCRMTAGRYEDTKKVVLLR